MANNLVVGNNGGIANQNISFVAAGVTSTNNTAIYQIGNPILVYRSDLQINQINGFEKDKSYYIIMKQAADWTAFLNTTSEAGFATPAAPTIVANDSANTLAASHALGNSEIEMSVADAAFVQYTGPIAVGDVARAEGYWKFRTKAAPGRTVSPVATSPAFTVSSAPIIYEDTFESADDTDIDGRSATTATPNPALTWSKVAGDGTLQILGNGVTGNPSGATVASKSKYIINHPVRNVDIRYTIKSVSSSSDLVGFGFWAMYAYVDENNYMQTYLGTGETYKKVGGAVTQLYAGSGLSAVNDVVRIVINGTSLKIYRNDTLLSDGTISATENVGTGHGILCDGSTATDKLGKFTSLTVV